jgi:hypothetical protein
MASPLGLGYGFRLGLRTVELGKVLLWVCKVVR